MSINKQLVFLCTCWPRMLTQYLGCRHWIKNIFYKQWKDKRYQVFYQQFNSEGFLHLHLAPTFCKKNLYLYQEEIRCLFFLSFYIKFHNQHTDMTKKTNHDMMFPSLHIKKNNKIFSQHRKLAGQVTAHVWQSRKLSKTLGITSALKQNTA